MKKTQRNFLCIGIIIIAISIIIIASRFISSAKELYAHILETNSYKNLNEFWFWFFLENIFVNAPIILSEIFLIKNGCDFLGKEKIKFQKTFCLISSVLIIVCLVLLYIGENSNYMYHVRQNYITASWILLFISFIVRVGSTTIRGLFCD